MLEAVADELVTPAGGVGDASNRGADDAPAVRPFIDMLRALDARHYCRSANKQTVIASHVEEGSE